VQPAIAQHMRHEARRPEYFCKRPVAGERVDPIAAMQAATPALKEYS
jgi:hypothetical protein